ncbi:MAG: hypothetical protein AAGF97_02340 [Planctomycetota bacterium]
MRVVDSARQAETRLRDQHTKLKPELQRLVLMCDLLAAKLRETQHRDAPRLLNELCDSIADMPSELDVRAAAVRVFSSELPDTKWMRPPKVDAPRDHATEVTLEYEEEFVLSAEGVTSLRDQYRRTQLEMGRFYRLCETMFRKFKERRNRGKTQRVASQHDFEELLRSATGLSMEDVQAAATRLGLETRNDQGNAEVAKHTTLLAALAEQAATA